MLKRRRLKKTDYRQRLKLLKSGQIRLVVRRRHNNIHIQFIKYEFNGDKTLVEVMSENIRKYGWKAHGGSLPAAYLTGLLAGRKGLDTGVDICVVDIGLHAAGANILYAAAKGVADAGVHVPLGFEISDDRMKGRSISEYAKLLKKSNERYKKQFSYYLRTGLDPENIMQHFEEVKAAIIKDFPGTGKRKVEAE